MDSWCASGPGPEGLDLAQNPSSAIHTLTGQSFVLQGQDFPRTDRASRFEVQLMDVKKLGERRLTPALPQETPRLTSTWKSSSTGRDAWLLKWYYIREGAFLPKVFSHLNIAKILDLKVLEHFIAKVSALPLAAMEWNHFSNHAHWHRHSVDKFVENWISSLLK